MPIWRGKTAVPSVGPEIHVKYEMDFSGKGLSSDSKELDKATAAVGSARAMLTKVISAMRSGATSLNEEMRNNLDYYFILDGKEINDRDFQIILQTLQLTAAGIFSSKLALKVSDLGDGTLGYVRIHPISRWSSPKSSWVAGRHHASGTHVYRGDMHIDVSRIREGENLATKTVIHEATHRYASTADFGERGYTDKGGRFRASGLTHKEALNNAESYASFVMRSAVWG